MMALASFTLDHADIEESGVLCSASGRRRDDHAAACTRRCADRQRLVPGPSASPALRRSELLMQRALSEGSHIDVERRILGIILDVEIEMRHFEVVSAMARMIRVMGWERQQPRDHDHHFGFGVA
jgi:hypothetical protein